MRQKLQRITFLTLRSLADVLLGAGLLWQCGLFIYQPRTLLSLLIVAVLWGCYRWHKGHFGSIRTALWALFGSGVAAYYLLPNPHPEQWQTSWAREPQFAIQGDTLTITNLRDFHYRSETDFDVRYRTESYDLNQLTEVDFAECHWDGMEAICHTMLSFGFADGRHFVISAETRLPAGEEQNALGGLYKRYGLLYVFGTEEDIFALRTNHRHEDLLLMPMNIKPGKARELLETFIAIAREAHSTRKPYNTATGNCSSGVMQSFRALAPNMPRIYDLAPIHNGSISRLLHKHGALIIRPGESYDALRRRCYLGYDIAPQQPGQYSQAIRQKLRENH